MEGMIMLEAYSVNVEVPANSSVPFNNIVLEKGCTATLASPTTIALNKCGVYVVTCTASAAAASTLQMYRDGVALPQSVTVGTNPTILSYIQVDRNNNPNCCCSSPVTVRVVNPTDAAETFTNVKINVSKLC